MPAEVICEHRPDLQDVPEFFKRRNLQIQYILAAMSFYGYLLVSTLRTNMSIAIVGMIKWSAIQNQTVEGECVYPSGSVRQAKEDGPYLWNLPLAGHILSCYFVGLALSQLLGLKLAESTRPRYVLLMATIFSAVFNCIIPQVSTDSGYYVMVVQVLKGFGHGIVIPSFNDLMGVWVPPLERPRFVAVMSSGLPIGAFFTLVITGVLCASADYGWAFIFYITSGLGIIWCILWCILIWDLSLVLPNLTEEETSQIISIQSQRAPLVIIPIPLRDIMTSVAMWAYMIAGFACAWMLCFYATIIPIYIATVLKFDIESNGLMSSVPSLAQAFSMVSTSVVTDHLSKNKLLKSGHIRKFCIAIGLIGYSICMVGLRFTGCNRTTTALLLVLGLGLASVSFSNITVVPVEMSHRFAGTISGIMNTLGALAGVIIPTLVGYLAKDKPTVMNWSWLFYASAGICTIAAIIFICLGSCKTQPWNDHTVPSPVFISAETSREAISLKPTTLSPTDRPKPSAIDLDDWREKRPWRTPSFPKLPPKPNPPIKFPE